MNNKILNISHLELIKHTGELKTDQCSWNILSRIETLYILFVCVLRVIRSLSKNISVWVYILNTFLLKSEALRSPESVNLLHLHIFMNSLTVRGSRWLSVFSFLEWSGISLKRLSVFSFCLSVWWLFVVFIIIINLSSSHHFECAYLLKVYFLHIFKIFIVILYCFGLNCLYSSVVRALLSRNVKAVGFDSQVTHILVKYISWCTCIGLVSL